MSDVKISWEALSEDALRGVIEEYVTREGTEYGYDEVSLEQKCEQVLAQLKRGEAVITWNEESQTCSILPV